MLKFHSAESPESTRFHQIPAGIPYQWFIKHLLADLEVVDMGPVVIYLGNWITCDRVTCTLWISQRPLLIELLQTWNMLDCTPMNMPLLQPLHKLPTPPPNSLSDICDDDIKLNFQQLVGSFIYLAICTQLDIAYAVMVLGQYNAMPTCAHLLAVKGILCYLAGTMDYGLYFTVPPPDILSSALHPKLCTH